MADAQQKYEDSLYAVQDLNEEYINSLQADYVATQQEMMQALSGINMNDYETFDEYRAAVEDVYRFYQERLEYYSNELGKVLENNSYLYNNDVLTYDAALSIKELRGESFTLHFKDTILGNMLENYNTLEGYTQDLVDTIGSWDDSTTMLGELKTNWDNWYSAINKVLETTGTSIENFGKTALYALADGTNPESLVSTFFWSSSDSQIALGSLLEFINNEGLDTLSSFQEAALKALVSNENGDSIKEQLEDLMKSAGYERGGEGYLNGLCEMFGITGTDAWMLKEAIKEYVGQDGKSTTPETLVGAFFTVMNSGTNNFGTLEQMVYGSVYTNRKAAKGIIPAIEDTRDTINNLTVVAEDDFENMADYVDDWEDMWVKEFENATDKNEKLYEAYMDLVDELSKYHDYPIDVKETRIVTTYVTQYDDQDYSYDPPPDKDNSSSLSSPTNSTKTKSDNSTNKNNSSGLTLDISAIAFRQHQQLHDGEADKGSRVQLSNGVYGKVKSKDGSRVTVKGDDGVLYYTDVSKLQTYDTGGYTGNWGTSAGRIAMIHEKELILNESDTENMLGAIGILRDLVSKIEINSLSAMTASLQTPNKVQPIGGSETIQQNITIQADFPGVQSHFEIEEAFNNLSLKASQYVNRK